MRAPIFLATLVIGSLAMASAQSLTDYLAARKKHGVTSTATNANVRALVGKKNIEVRGTLRGGIRSGDSAMLMIDLGDGDTLAVKAIPAPEWMFSDSLVVRALVQMDRAHKDAALEGVLLTAAPETMVAAKLPIKTATPPKTVASSTVRKPPTTPSRSSSSNRGRPAPMPGEIRNQPKDDPNWTVSAQEAVPLYANFIRSVNKRLSSTQATRIAESIIGFSLRFDVDARLIVALVMTESTFNPNTKSHAGAMGLGQLMPGTAKMLGVSNPYDTDQNLYGSVKYLAGHINTYTARTGDDFEGLVLALAAYNAGPGAVKKHGGVPPYRETQNYVRKVMSLYRQLSGQ